jgi:hypothetical protein
MYACLNIFLLPDETLSPSKFFLGRFYLLPEFHNIHLASSAKEYALSTLEYEPSARAYEPFFQKCSSSVLLFYKPASLARGRH